MFVKSNRGWLALTFVYKSERLTEYLHLRDSRANRNEARQLARDIEAEIRAGTFDYARRFPNSNNLERVGIARVAADALTLRQFASDWLQERKPLLKPVVRANYEATLRNHVLLHPVAAKPLAEVNDGDINRLIADLKLKPGRAGKELSPRAINMVLGRLRTIFKVARRRKLIAEDPMSYVSNLRQPKPEVDPFDMGEALRLLEAAEGWEHAFLSVLLFTGLRPNEALALTWPMVDWDHRLILVRKTLSQGRSALPKTPGSEREVEMPKAVRAALQNQRARSELRGELVFPSATGTAVDLDNFRARNWPRILRRAKVRARPLYQCRHTCARLLLEQGDTPQHVAAQLGHTSLRMLFDVYGRWLQRPQSRGIAALDEAVEAHQKLVLSARSEQPLITLPSPIFDGHQRRKPGTAGNTTQPEGERADGANYQ